MLIRLVQHHIDNPSQIDKLICIKGLPEEWFFRNTKNGRELVAPWEPDVEVNIPQSIRHLCEPMDIVQVYPPIEKGKDPIVDHKRILGLRFNFNSQPGEELWEKIERYLDKVVPRDQQVPKPVQVAKDVRSPFEPYRARRNHRGTLELEVAEIPVIDLREFQPETPVITTSVAVPKENVTVTSNETTSRVNYECEICSKKFDKERALKMHRNIKHKKEPVGV